MILSLCGSLCFILRGASCFKVFSCSLSSCFFISFSIVITSLGAEEAGLCASRAFVCLFVCFVRVSFLPCSHPLGQFLSFFSSFWCQSLAAACDCGTPCTFLLTFFSIFCFII